MESSLAKNMKNVIKNGPCEPSQLAHARADATGGSETIYHHSMLKSFNYTQGVKITKDMARADWLIDLIAFKVVPHLRKRSAGFVGGDVFKVVLDVDRWPAPGAPAAVVQVLALWPVGRETSQDRWGSWDIESTDHPVGKWDFLLGRTMVGQRAVEMLWLPQED